jgi:hypothetical protein
MISDHFDASFPDFPKAQTLHWNLPEPFGIWDYRKTRYEIAARVHSFLNRERYSLREAVFTVG